MSPEQREPLSTDERELAQRLARLPAAPDPSPALDARILAAAREELGGASSVVSPSTTAPRRHARRSRWPVALGAAASLALVVGLAWQVRPLQQARQERSEAPMQAVRVSHASGPSAVEDADGAAAAARDTASVANAASPSPREEVAPVAAADAVAQEPAAQTTRERAKSAPDSFPAGAAAVQGVQTEDAPPADASMHRRSNDAAADLPAIVLPPTPAPQPVSAGVIAPVAAPAPAAPPPPEPVEQAPSRRALDSITVTSAKSLDQESAAAQADAVVQDAKARAAAKPAAAATTTSEQADSLPFNANRAAAGSDARAGATDDEDSDRETSDQSLDDEPPATADSPVVQQAWLQRIRDLVASGQTDAARASLAEFRRRYPAVVLPQDLRALVH